MAQPLPPPGWYPAPDGRTLWWDGTRWVVPPAPSPPTQPYAQAPSPPTGQPARSRTGLVVAAVAGVALLLCAALATGAYLLAGRGDDGTGRPSNAQAVAAVQRALLPCSPSHGIRLSEAKVSEQGRDEAVVRAPGFFRRPYTATFVVAPDPDGHGWTVRSTGTDLPEGVDLSCALDEVDPD